MVFVLLLPRKYLDQPFKRLLLLASASNKVICYRWGAMLTQLRRMNVDTALTEVVSESDHFCNVNTTYTNSGNVFLSSDTGCVRRN